jgi:hypothetical protein
VSNASAAVNSFIVDAGSKRFPAFDENSVSPRVSETIIAPQLPLRVRAFRKVPISEASASAPIGVVNRNGGGAARRAVGRRVAFVFELFAAVGRVVVLAPPVGLERADGVPPSCAVELASGSVSAAVATKTVTSRGARRGELRREVITMSDLATGVPGTPDNTDLLDKVPDW